MSILHVRKEISRFLRSTNPEVVCITGRWGVGKTYAWEHFLREAQEEGAVGLPRYSYVSLFGRNSLEDVRSALVESTLDSGAKGKKPDLGSYEAVYTQAMAHVGHVSWLAKLITGNNKYTDFIYRALYLGLKEQIICIDDLERAGPGLPIKDVLGLVSQLCTSKYCKVVVLLNQDALNADDKLDFQAQIEKVADITLTFSPSPTEAAAIGLKPNTPLYEKIYEDVRELGITNIRVVRKAESMCNLALDILVGYDRRIIDQSIDTIVLAAYARFQPDVAPSLAFIKSYNNIIDLMQRREGSQDEVDRNHKDLLRRYGFSNLDAFDRELVAGVENGFLDPERLKAAASEIQSKLSIGDKNIAFQNAWTLLHSSFDNNEEEVIEDIIRAVHANIEIISPYELNDTVILLKTLDRMVDAQTIIKYYVEHRQASSSFTGT